MKLSIVTTLYRSARHIETFLKRARAAARSFAGEDYEIVIVNDGSPDESLAIVLWMARDDENLGARLVVVDLSRNFGHHRALMAGMAQAKGDYLFLIDSDLEEPPELLDVFSVEMERTGSDLVYGVQAMRKGAWKERVGGALFYRLFNALSRLQMPANPLTARLMTRRYVDALLRHGETEIFLAGLMHIVGFDQRTVTVEKFARERTSYSFRRRLSLLVNGVTSFSNAPLVMIFYTGMTILALAGFYTAYLVINWLFFAEPLLGWTSVMASIWLLGGMVISFVGIIGIYLAKTFAEVKQRPGHIVRHIYRKET